MKVAQIRQKFLDYFQSKGHEIIASSSLIPSGDPTLLFTTAGMVQFKPYFTGAVDLKFTKAATSQKCLRTSDLENVGKTERHCTFFEMLGNFSFGDYFKEEAIHYALDFSLNHLNIDKEKIWITVYLDDEEAIRFWQAEGISKDKIRRLGKEDNFWGPAGDSGACGPCSELYLDRGVEKGYEGCGTKTSCKPGCNCDRFLEYWNLVFNQFDQDTSGVQHPLKQTGIDTGSGLERVALLLQNVDSVFDTDELQRIIQYIETLSGQKYSKETQAAFRVLTDHSRAICFAIADGVMPDKTGRGYVIRRLIRRASLFARKLQIQESFLYKIIPEIISIYSISYPELQSKEKFIIQILRNEEELFLNTLELGLEVLENKMKKLSKENSILMGKDSFQLYGTYGFPKEMTKEILEERGFDFDLKSFEEELEKDRTLSRDSWKGKKSSLLSSQMNFPITEFTGYENTKDSGKLIGILSDGVQKNSASENTETVFVLNRSSFYGESGGQIGDSGFIKSKDSIFKVLDTWKENDIILHIGIVLKGKFEQNETVTTEVEFKKRENLTLHHSGTHLLNGALRKLLGEHVHQKASLVSDEYLRFDFSHPIQLKEEEILEIESTVNHAIDKSVSVNTKVLAIEEAKKTGAVAFFDEKYGDQVRVVSMDSYSTEFCGGTHVRNTSELSYFYIIKESSPGAGNRRIEAVCGEKVVERIQEEFQILQNKIETYHLKSKDFFKSSEHFIKLKSPTPIEIKNLFQEKKSSAVNYFRNLKKTIEQEIQNKTDFLIKEKKSFEKKESEQLFGDIESIIENGLMQNKTKLFLHNFSNQKIENLKEIADRLKNREEKILICFFNENPDNETILLMTNKISLASGTDCKQIFQAIPKDLQVRGGGKSDMVQGSFDKSKKESIINSIKIELLKE